MFTPPHRQLDISIANFPDYVREFLPFADETYIQAIIDAFDSGMILIAVLVCAVS